jgi:hypothetical protein
MEPPFILNMVVWGWWLVVGGWWLRCEKSVDELVMNDVSVNGEAMKSHDCSGLYTRLAPC